MGDVQTLRRSVSAVSSVPASAVANENVASVHDFQAFKARKVLNGERKTGLNQTFRAAPPSSVAASSPEASDVDLASRIERIKSSINRINALMTELRSSSETPKV